VAAAMWIITLGCYAVLCSVNLHFTYLLLNHCEGVSITQRNNSAVLGFKQTYSDGWGET